MEPVKIVGEWRRGGELEPGVYLLKSELSEASVAALKIGDGGQPDREYLGPIEIVEHEPVPTPMPGCRLDFGRQDERHWCGSVSTETVWRTELVTYGDTRRQAVLRHNAAVAAIVATDGE